MKQKIFLKHYFGIFEVDSVKFLTKTNLAKQVPHKEPPQKQKLETFIVKFPFKFHLRVRLAIQ